MLGKEILYFTINDHKDQRDNSSFFEYCVAATMAREYKDCLHMFEEHKVQRINENGKFTSILEVDGLFMSISNNAFNISTKLEKMPFFEFVCSVGDESVEHMELLFLESTMSNLIEKTKQDVGKYEGVFEKYLLKIGKLEIKPKNVHLVIIHDKDNTLKEGHRIEISKKSYLFKSISVWYCDYGQLLDCWSQIPGNQPMTNKPTNIFAYLDFQMQQSKSEIMRLKALVNQHEEQIAKQHMLIEDQKKQIENQHIQIENQHIQLKAHELKIENQEMKIADLQHQISRLLKEQKKDEEGKFKELSY